MGEETKQKVFSDIKVGDEVYLIEDETLSGGIVTQAHHILSDTTLWTKDIRFEAKSESTSYSGSGTFVFIDKADALEQYEKIMVRELKRMAMNLTKFS